MIIFGNQQRISKCSKFDKNFKNKNKQKTQKEL